MSQSLATEPAFGSCTHEDLVALDLAVQALHEAEDELSKCRTTLGAVMGRMLEKGAHRRAIARRAGVSDQTVTNTVYGRPTRRS